MTPSPHLIRIVSCVADAWPGLVAPQTGLVGRALAKGVSTLHVHDVRAHGRGKHRIIDDAPFGGGAGMVLMAEPLLAAIKAARAQGPGPVVVLAPRGRPFRQADARCWAEGPGVTLVCGRYEGIDERVYGAADDCVSVGDAVLSGGDPAALCIVDAIVRLREGTLGNEKSLVGESFDASHGGLGPPVYTRPAVLAGQSVPEALQSGDHARIRAWRHEAAEALTRTYRPELLRERLPKSP